MRRQMAGRGFTLVELLVVIAIIGILVALLLPAIQAAREAARRTQCNNNLHNIAISLQNYHDTYKMFPMGAMHAGLATGSPPVGPFAIGPSWWYGTLPFTEGRNIYDKIAATQRAGVAAPITAGMYFAAGSLEPGGAGATQGALGKMIPEYMRCPTSPLPIMEKQTGPICLPTYVGIAGGCDINAASPDFAPAPAANIPPVSARFYNNRSKGTTLAANGIATASGMLPACEQVGISNCSDGTSNTMIVGEQSDWLQDLNPNNSTKYHGDPGWNALTPNGTADAGGWISGTNAFPRVPLIPGAIPTTGGTAQPWGNLTGNITVVRYRPNYKKVAGTWQPGCAESGGINNPLQSAHSGGLQAAMTDGSVQFISQTMDLAILLRLSIRDDGQPVNVSQ